ncbi:D-alanyl-D-alanine carboxypeptidase/D-alanyl-D-alanine-endopeptidase [Solibacillus sp. CAU 1738]|uniref:D-alanyl-D-alanine carboxypeptidase/D-alanyl-D-alanine endopeptidase n=1 Tax=Solibacillus sp. CAU 1738 TaxID=3140363 RepID=UPI003261851D
MRKISIFMLLFLLLFNMPVSATANVLDSSVTENLGSSNVSVSLRSLSTGHVLYEHGGNTLMKPASTLKLLTGATALSVLGNDFKFTTKLYIDGEIENDVLYGDVYIEGSGDPTLQKGDFITFAKVLKRKGIRTINGHIYGDDSLFTGSHLTPGIVKDDETEYYAARTTALTMSPNEDYDAGTIIINVTGTTAGKAPIFTALPNASGMKIVNKARTVSRGAQNTVTVKRNYGTNTVVIAGNIPQGSTVKEWVTLNDPTINTLHAIKDTWLSAGIRFSTTSNLKRHKTPNTAKLLYTKQSMPLDKLYPIFMKLSNNSIADILVKTIGKKERGIGNTESGLVVMRDYAKTIGLDVTKWRFEDGSGMSHNNKVSANELTSLLFIMQQQPVYNNFYNSLPIGGQKDRFVGGSLRKRFDTAELRNRVVAKTGSLTQVYTLAGYVTANSGRKYAFSIMVENKSPAAINGIDRVVESIIKNY